jgi:carbohydrate diacid regulator
MIAYVMSRVEFELSPQFARTVITQVMSLLGRDVSVSDKSGKLIASFDPNQVGQRLNGVEAMIKKGEAANLEQDQAVGFAVAHESEPVGAVIIHADPGAVKDFVPITQSLVELLVGQEAEQGLADNLDQLLWRFFHSASDAEREKLVSEIRLLGVDLTKPRFAVLFHVPDFAAKLSQANDKTVPIERYKEKLSREVQAVFPASNDNTVTYFGHERFLLLKDAGRGEETLDLFQQKSGQMAKNIGGNPTAGIGNRYLGIGGLLTSFREAETALRLGLKLRKPGRAYRIDDLGLYVVFGEVSTDRQVHLAKRLLAPLLKEADLLKTLRAYFEANLNLTKAAQKLHIHRNTLIYRLGKIKDLTKLDPEQFEGAVQLKMALTLLDLE